MPGQSPHLFPHDYAKEYFRQQKNEGDQFTTILNEYYSGGLGGSLPSAASTYTAQLWQDGTNIMSTSTRYIQLGALTLVSLSFVVSGAGVAGNPVRITLPVSPVATMSAGIFRITDISVPFTYIGKAMVDRTNMGTGVLGSCYGIAHGSGSYAIMGTSGSSAFTAALATSDEVTALIGYFSA